MDEIKKMDIDEPTIAKPFTNINDVMDNPGFSQISLKILCFLVNHPVLAPDSTVLVTLGTPKMSDPMVICWTEETVLLTTILTLLVLVTCLQ